MNLRATMINAAVRPGNNVLITGIGGGVALMALQLCVAKGASVYVTSGSQEKIDKAIKLGAKGGANYKDGQFFASSAAPRLTLDDVHRKMAETHPSSAQEERVEYLRLGR